MALLFTRHKNGFSTKIFLLLLTFCYAINNKAFSQGPSMDLGEFKDYPQNNSFNLSLSNSEFLMCGGTFVDDGGLTGPYSSNADPATDNWLFCPDNPGDVVTITFNNF